MPPLKPLNKTIIREILNNASTSDHSATVGRTRTLEDSEKYPLLAAIERAIDSYERKDFKLELKGELLNTPLSIPNPQNPQNFIETGFQALLTGKLTITPPEAKTTEHAVLLQEFINTIKSTYNKSTFPTLATALALNISAKTESDPDVQKGLVLTVLSEIKKSNQDEYKQLEKEYEELKEEYKKLKQPAQINLYDEISKLINSKDEIQYNDIGDDSDIAPEDKAILKDSSLEGQILRSPMLCKALEEIRQIRQKAQLGNEINQRLNSISGELKLDLTGLRPEVIPSEALEILEKAFLQNKEQFATGLQAIIQSPTEPSFLETKGQNKDLKDFIRTLNEDTSLAIINGLREAHSEYQASLIIRELERKLITNLTTTAGAVTPLPEKLQGSLNSLKKNPALRMLGRWAIEISTDTPKKIDPASIAEKLIAQITMPSNEDAFTHADFAELKGDVTMPALREIRTEYHAHQAKVADNRIIVNLKALETKLHFARLAPELSFKKLYENKENPDTETKNLNTLKTYLNGKTDAEFQTAIQNIIERKDNDGNKREGNPSISENPLLITEDNLHAFILLAKTYEYAPEINNIFNIQTRPAITSAPPTLSDIVKIGLRNDLIWGAAPPDTASFKKSLKDHQDQFKNIITSKKPLPDPSTDAYASGIRLLLADHLKAYKQAQTDAAKKLHDALAKQIKDHKGSPKTYTVPNNETFKDLLIKTLLTEDDKNSNDNLYDEKNNLKSEAVAIEMAKYINDPKTPAIDETSYPLLNNILQHPNNPLTIALEAQRTAFQAASEKQKDNQQIEDRLNDLLIGKEGSNNPEATINKGKANEFKDFSDLKNNPDVFNAFKNFLTNPDDGTIIEDNLTLLKKAIEEAVNYIHSLPPPIEQITVTTGVGPDSKHPNPTTASNALSHYNAIMIAIKKSNERDARTVQSALDITRKKYQNTRKEEKRTANQPLLQELNKRITDLQNNLLNPTDGIETLNKTLDNKATSSTDSPTDDVETKEPKQENKPVTQPISQEILTNAINHKASIDLEIKQIETAIAPLNDTKDTKNIKDQLNTLKELLKTKTDALAEVKRQNAAAQDLLPKVTLSESTTRFITTEDENDPTEAFINEIEEKSFNLADAKQQLAADNKFITKETRDALQEKVDLIEKAAKIHNIDTNPSRAFELPLKDEKGNFCKTPEDIKGYYDKIKNNNKVQQGVKNLAASYIRTYNLIMHAQGGAGTRINANALDELKNLEDLISDAKEADGITPKGTIQKAINAARSRLFTLVLPTPEIAAEEKKHGDHKAIKDDKASTTAQKEAAERSMKEALNERDRLILTTPPISLNLNSRRPGFGVDQAEIEYLKDMIIASEALLQAGKKVYQEQINKTEQSVLIRPFGTPRIRIEGKDDNEKRAKANAWAKETIGPNHTEVKESGNPNITAMVDSQSPPKQSSTIKFQKINTTQNKKDEWYKSNSTDDKEGYNPKAPVTLTHVKNNGAGQRSFREMILELPLELTDHFQLACLLARDIESISPEASDPTKGTDFKKNGYTREIKLDEDGKVENEYQKRTLDFLLKLMKDTNNLPKNLDNNQKKLEDFFETLEDNGYRFKKGYAYSEHSRRAAAYMDNLDSARNKNFPKYMSFTKKYMDGLITERRLNKDIPDDVPLKFTTTNALLNEAAILYCSQLTGENKKIMTPPQPTGKKFSTSYSLKEYFYGFAEQNPKKTVSKANDFDLTEFQPAIEGSKTIKDQRENKNQTIQRQQEEDKESLGTIIRRDWFGRR